MPIKINFFFFLHCLQVFMRMAGNIYTQSHNSIFTVQNLDREYDKEINQW